MNYNNSIHATYNHIYFPNLSSQPTFRISLQPTFNLFPLFPSVTATCASTYFVFLEYLDRIPICYCRESLKFFLQTPLGYFEEQKGEILIIKLGCKIYTVPKAK